MASYTVTKAKHATLVAATVDTVTLAAANEVAVTNRSSADTIFFRLDGTAPVVDGDDSYVVGPLAMKVVNLAPEIATVKLISSGAAPYSVEGV